MIPYQLDASTWKILLSFPSKVPCNGFAMSVCAMLYAMVFHRDDIVAEKKSSPQKLTPEEIVSRIGELADGSMQGVEKDKRGSSKRENKKGLTQFDLSFNINGGWLGRREG